MVMVLFSLGKKGKVTRTSAGGGVSVAFVTSVAFASVAFTVSLSFSGTLSMIFAVSSCKDHHRENPEISDLDPGSTGRGIDPRHDR